jgi:hypothetical protein
MEREASGPADTALAMELLTNLVDQVPLVWRGDRHRNRLQLRRPQLRRGLFRLLCTDSNRRVFSADLRGAAGSTSSRERLTRARA